MKGRPDLCLTIYNKTNTTIWRTNTHKFLQFAFEIQAAQKRIKLDIQQLIQIQI